MKMRVRLTYLALLLLTLCGVGRVAAQPRAGKGCVETEIHFRWDSAVLDTTYLTNPTALGQLSERIHALGSLIDSVVIVSHASPEGTQLHNKRLSERRAATMRRYMLAEYPQLSDRLRVSSAGESWAQLRHRIASDQRLSNQSIERLLAILDDPTTSIDTKKWRIERDPVRWYLYTTHYPQIRNSMICLVYFHDVKRVEPLAVEASQPTAPLRATELSAVPMQIQRDTLTVAVKSNLLYDAATALNFEIEVPIGNHWSVAAENLFPWWEKGNKYCFQIWEMGIEGRYWFRENRYHNHKLQGWFVGPYVMSGKYDLQWKNDLNYQGEFYSAGLSAGYAMPISRRLNLEFSLSVGYLSTAYRHYFHADDYSELFHDGKSGRTGYFGPTKVKIALVWPLHIPYKKGGRR